MNEKRQIIEATQRYLGGGNAPPDIRKKYPYDIVSIYVGMAYGLYINEIYKSDTDPNKVFLDSLTKAYPAVAVSNDTTRGERYSLIPTSKLFPLPNNHSIRHIGPVDDQTTKFIPRANNTSWVFSQLEVNTMLTSVRYYVEDGKIFYSSHIEDIDPIPETLLMKLVVPFTEYASDEEVPLPWGGDIRIFDLVVQLLRQTPPPDEINDANTTQIET